ncbi:hypothetical protein COV18_05455 [Candidatus Woesearchaeota archaeon CG10_big_fil_rev_8_21_14_0_10_37_12]|nr:MAG: hypothetical protein COV18_05455 [Candidatus Woesearchaeota archaeon CG10_big_fil_rev_8_21_14_0_10_37_12]
MNTKLLQQTSIIMIILIVSLPIVAAQSLNVVKIVGQDNVDGYLRSRDSVTIEVLANIPQETTIDRTQVWLILGQTRAPFDDCTQQGNSTNYKCTLTAPNFQAFQKLTFTIELQTDAGDIVGSQTRTVIVDALSPAIKDFGIEPELSGGDITLTYITEDYGLQQGSLTDCAGIKEIKVISEGQTILSDTAPPGTCSKDNNVPHTITQEGEHDLCITAADHVNHTAIPQCVTVTIDRTPPEITDLAIVDANNFEITHVKSGQERTAAVQVIIEDTGEVESTTVRANLAQLNPDLANELPPDLSQQDLFIWENINVFAVTPCTVTITAEDVLGNRKQQLLNCNIGEDDTPPTVTGLQSQQTRSNIPLYSLNSDLVVVFEDKDNNNAQGIGLQRTQAFLDLRTLGLGEFVQAERCDFVSNKWECFWTLNPPARIAEGEYTIKAVRGTADDLDNVLPQEVPLTLIYDNTPPTNISLVNFTALTGQETYGLPEGQEVAVRGARVKYTMRALGAIDATANFSAIGGSEDVAGNCFEDNEGYLACDFEEDVELSGPYFAPITFTFSDDAGNKAVHQTELEIFDIQEEIPAYWNENPEITCSPSIISRRTASVVAPLVTCKIALRTPHPNVETLSIQAPTVDECVGGELDLNNIRMINTAPGSKNPYFFINLERKNYYQDQINITCPINIYSVKRTSTGGDQFHIASPNAQTINVHLQIPFYDAPLKDIYEQRQDDIKDAIDRDFATQEWLGDLNQILHYGELLCQANAMITGILNAFYLMTVAFKGMPPPTDYATEPIGTSFCTIEETVFESYIGTIKPYLDQFCKVANCAASASEFTEVPTGIGDMAAWCSSWAEGLQDANLVTEGGFDLGGMAQESGLQAINVKDSLIWSTVCLCLPGIIKNLEELRQVSCFKAVCLNDYVRGYDYVADNPTEPVRPEFCDEMESYLTCTYIIGELFAAIPFWGIFEQLVDLIMDLIADPFSVLPLAVGVYCYTQCPIPDTPAVIACASFKLLSVTLEAAYTVARMSEEKDLLKVPNNARYCERLSDIESEIKEGKGTEGLT